MQKKSKIVNYCWRISWFEKY